MNKLWRGRYNQSWIILSTVALLFAIVERIMKPYEHPILYVRRFEQISPATHNPDKTKKMRQISCRIGEKWKAPRGTADQIQGECWVGKREINANWLQYLGKCRNGNGWGSRKQQQQLVPRGKAKSQRGVWRKGVGEESAKRAGVGHAITYPIQQFS